MSIDSSQCKYLESTSDNAADISRLRRQDRSGEAGHLGIERPTSLAPYTLELL